MLLPRGGPPPLLRSSHWGLGSAEGARDAQPGLLSTHFHSTQTEPPGPRAAASPAARLAQPGGLASVWLEEAGSTSINIP